jgi:DNA-binding response OmpR family regulator
MIDEKFLKTLTILYVDNNDNTRNEYKQTFEKVFKKVLICIDGLDAIEKFNNANINNEKIDAIISEVLLSRIDGIELLTQVRKSNENIPFIFTTASTKKEYLIQSIKNGVSEYLVKPFDPLMLLEKIEAICPKEENKNVCFKYINESKDYLNTINKVALVSIFDSKKKLHYANDFLLEVSKYDIGDLLEQDYTFNYHSDISKTILDEQWNKLQSYKKWKGKLKQIAKNDSIFYTNTTIIPVTDKNNKDNKRFVSIDFLTTKEENRKRDYKKKVLYSLKETKRVYQVAQEKINQLKDEISMYEDNSKYEEESKKINEINTKNNIELKKLENKLKQLDLELNTKIEINKLQKEINVADKLIKEISKEIVAISLGSND